MSIISGVEELFFRVTTNLIQLSRSNRYSNQGRQMHRTRFLSNSSSSRPHSDSQSDWSSSPGEHVIPNRLFVRSQIDLNPIPGGVCISAPYPGGGGG